MAYEAQVLSDSISERGDRLTTLEVTIPRIVLAEFNTHRVFSRNSASSRAIPTRKQLSMIMEHPVVPDIFGRNQPRMEPDLERPLNQAEISEASETWLQARDDMMSRALQIYLGRTAFEAACLHAGGLKLDGTDATPDRRDILSKVIDELPKELDKDYADKIGVKIEQLLGVHKQYANRLLEPFMWHKVIVTATEWQNFFALRANPAAQREIKLPAEMMLKALDDSEPGPGHSGAVNGINDIWHLPLIHKEDFELAEDIKRKGSVMDVLIKVAVGRCARVSYLTHDGVRDLEKDLELYHRLAKDGHMSPMEHVARVMAPSEYNKSQWSGNFKGWHQHRKDIAHEENYAKVIAQNPGKTP